MMAWMDRHAVAETMRTGRVCYWSRSRRAPWRKGDTSGHTQSLVDLRVDCDGDTLLGWSSSSGVACHTGRHNCFFRAIRAGALEDHRAGEIDMATDREGSSLTHSVFARRALLVAALALPVGACTTSGLFGQTPATRCRRAATAWCAGSRTPARTT